jgi:hypothetical protein
MTLSITFISEILFGKEYEIDSVLVITKMQQIQINDFKVALHKEITLYVATGDEKKSDI